MVEEGDSAESVTQKVSCLTFSIHGINVTIADTPGFFGTDKESHDIVSEIKKNISNVDLILFCINMCSRFTESEEQLISIIRKEYSKTVLLRNTIFALTFANEVRVPKKQKDKVTLSKHFDNKLKEMRKIVISAVERHGGLTNQEASQIPVIPVGDDDCELPTIKDWLKEFWSCCFKHTLDDSTAALLAIAVEQMSGSDIDQLEDQARNENHSILIKLIEILKKFFRLMIHR